MILCCGESLIDMLPRKTEAGEDAFAPYPGGAVFNTAIALGRLGSKTGFFSGISDDLFGQILMDALRASNVDTSLAERSDRPTTLAFVRLIEGQASYAFYDEQTAGRMLDAARLPAVTDETKALFFGGISLVAEPAAIAYETLMLREAPARVCMIDPNIRPGFIRDEPRYRARVTGMIEQADIIKVSDEDMEWLYGAGSAQDHAAQMLSGNTKLVCVTEGAKGVTGYTRKGQVFAPAHKARVVDTVGAGDTFNAGLLHGLEQRGCLNKGALQAMGDDDLMFALDMGARAASVTVARAGANPPWHHELP